MPPQPLSAATRAKLTAASPQAVEDAASKLIRYLHRDRWLGNNNRYLRRTVKTVIADAGTPHDSDAKHLSEYVAASAVLHTTDGWSYLGRAISAQCAGDAAVARHLAYYAELRAALGLLSTQGVAIFSQKNVVVKRNGQVDFFPGLTHLTTWQALEHWSNQPGAASLLSTLVRPAGSPLADWVAGLGLGEAAWSPVGREWLRAWGLDLRLFGRDRTTRNEASYRPTMLRPTSPTPSADASFLQGLWPLLEPSPGDPFQYLDRHLLRLTLERAFQSVTSRPAVGDYDFGDALRRTVRATIGIELESTIGQFLSRDLDSATPPLFEAAARRASHLDPTYHRQVIARAALLLRVATGASARLLARGQIEQADYRFWLERLAENHGICDIGELPDDPADLWIDVNDALDELSELVGDGGDRSFFSLLRGAAPSIDVLSSCERVALWGLAA